ncbi:MAG TPA: hypothetical protein VGF65_19385, partial [Mycobacterium sp.]
GATLRGDRAGLTVVGIGSDMAGFHLLQDAATRQRRARRNPGMKTKVVVLLSGALIALLLLRVISR